MNGRLRDETGITIVELLVVMLILGLVMAGITNVFVSGLRASSTSNATVAGQQSLRVAVQRLEFEARCSSGATTSGSGSTVVLTLPAQCTHVSGTYTWCVTGGNLVRASGSSCASTGQVFASGVTTATPFSLLTATGYLPRLQINLGVNAGGSGSTAVSIADVITLRNGTRT